MVTDGVEERVEREMGTLDPHTVFDELEKLCEHVEPRPVGDDAEHVRVSKLDRVAEAGVDGR